MTDTASHRWPWLAIVLATVLPLSSIRADSSTSIASCRELRHDSPQTALTQCEQAARALSQAGHHEEAFEAWMHTAELSSQLGRTDDATSALDQAVTLLPAVDDPLALHRITRRRGLNAYREGDTAVALTRFLEALAVARSVGDVAALAVSENDLGVIHRHIGHFTAALEHFQTSLRLRQSLAHDDLGALMANIGSLHLELGDLDQAQTYLSHALADHRNGQRVLAEHRTLEELARLARLRDDPTTAERYLDQAWQHYRSAGAQPDQLRLALARVDHHARLGQRQPARRWLAIVRDLAGQAASARDVPVQIALAAADVAEPGEYAASYDALLAASTDVADASPELQARAQARLADLAEALARPEPALAHLRRFHELDSALSAQRHDESLQALRVRFDVARLEAEHDRLAAQSARSEAALARWRSQVVIGSAIALLALVVAGLILRSRLLRQQARQRQERQGLERSIAESRQAANALRSDLRTLTRLLDQLDGATLLFDAGGRIRAATAGAATILGRNPVDLDGQPLSAVLPAPVANWAQALIEAASLSSDDPDRRWLGEQALETPAGSLVVRCRRLALEEEMGVLQFGAATLPDDGDSPVAPASPEADAIEDDPDKDRIAFRQRLVQLMVTSLELWERGTRKGRIDLAEASGIWRITVDDGRLRVRAMDRYLRLETLPERPRWREVLRTAYFVLAELALEPDQRSDLEAQVQAVLALSRTAP